MAALETTLTNLDIFLTLTKASHFLLYLPYSGHSLLSFLDSCFHRDFTRHIAARGFREVAVFTERAWLGKVFVLLSRREGRFGFGMETSRVLQEGGVFGGLFGGEWGRGMLPAWAVEENVLLVQQEGFYLPERMEGRPGADVDATGAQTLLIYAGLRDGIYDIRRQVFLSEPAAHKCESIWWPCSEKSEREVALPDWGDLFGPPWDTPYSGIYKMSPYMALNILTSELGPLAEKPVGSGRGSTSVPSEPQPTTTSQTMENADRIIRKARQSIHEFSLLKRSFSPRLQQNRLTGQYASSSSLNNPPLQAVSRTSPTSVSAHVMHEDNSHSPSSDPRRSNNTTHRSSPTPAFQDLSRPLPSMDVTQMLLDELRKAKPDRPTSAKPSTQPIDTVKSPFQGYREPEQSPGLSLGTGLARRLTVSGYGQGATAAPATDSDSDTPSESSRISPPQRASGKAVDDSSATREREKRVDTNLDIGGGTGFGNNTLSGLDPSTLDMLVRKLEAVKDLGESSQGASPGNGKARRRRKKRPQAGGDQEIEMGGRGVSGDVG